MKRSIYETVTQDIIREIENGAMPWLKPWTGSAGGSLPFNAVSQRHYSGTNILLLWSRSGSFPTNAWLTFKQAKALGGFVRKGERGTGIVYTSTATKEKRNDVTGEVSTETFGFLKGYTVFNVAQCDGLPGHMTAAPAEIPEPVGIENADRFLAAIGADVRHGGDRACYVPSADCINLPHAGTFKDMPHYYATSLHEHAHWSGSDKRLAREFGKRFGDDAYAFEELVAEMSAAFLCAQLGIKGEMRHAGYLDHWLGVLKRDNRAIFTAASKASEAADYLRKHSEPVSVAA